jgi:hypothetical protein
MNLAFGGVHITITSGALIPILLMIPNAAWMVVPKGDSGTSAAEPWYLTVVERIGLAAVLIIPFFHSLDLHKPFAAPAAIGMAVLLAVYYICWIRYFLGGRTVELLGASLLGLPLPLAVAPVVWLALSSYLMGSWWMLGASALFGFAHIWVSALTL